MPADQPSEFWPFDGRIASRSVTSRLPSGRMIGAPKGVDPGIRGSNGHKRNYGGWVFATQMQRVADGRGARQPGRLSEAQEAMRDHLEACGLPICAPIASTLRSPGQAARHPARRADGAVRLGKSATRARSSASSGSRPRPANNIIHGMCRSIEHRQSARGAAADGMGICRRNLSVPSQPDASLERWKTGYLPLFVPKTLSELMT